MPLLYPQPSASCADHASVPLSRPQVRLSAVVEKEDVEKVQALVDVILKSDPSAQVRVG